MKNKFILSLLVALAAISYTHIVKAADTLGVFIVQPGLPDSIPFGTTRNIRFVFENKGSTVFQGNVGHRYALYDFGDSTFTVIDSLDSGSFEILNPGDTVGITINQDFSGPLYQPGGGNTVVIWPVVAPEVHIVDSIFWKPILYLPTSVTANFLERLNYRLIPNPSSDFIELIAKKKIVPEQVRIYDLNGRLVGNYTNTTKINIHNLPVGSYTVGVKIQGYKLEYLQFIKE